MKFIFVLLLPLYAINLYAQSLDGINNIEGLYYEYDEFENYLAFSTEYFLMTDTCPYVARWRLSPLLQGDFLEKEDILKNLFHDRNLYSLWLDVTGLDNTDYEKRLIFLIDGEREEIADSNFETYAFFGVASGTLRTNTMLFGTSIKTDIEMFMNAKEAKFRLERCQGVLGDSCLSYLELLYRAIVLEQWKSMIPEGDTIN